LELEVPKTLGEKKMPKFDFIEDADLREKAENAHKIDVDQLTIDLTNAAKTQVDEAVGGLKTKNSELLDEKKAQDAKLKLFEGYDPKDLKTATDFYAKNKDAEFLKDGTVEELIEKKTSQLTSDFETKITELNTNLTEAQTGKSTYKNLFEGKTIDDGVRAEAIKAGMLPTAVEDAVMRGRSVFSLDDNKQIEARDKDGKLAQTEDKKVLTTKNWVEGLKTTSPHYWPGSQGAGAFGGDGGPEGDRMEKLDAAAKSGDVAAYRKIRDAKKKK